jgi:hypothetical protein
VASRPTARKGRGILVPVYKYAILFRRKLGSLYVPIPTWITSLNADISTHDSKEPTKYGVHREDRLDAQRMGNVSIAQRCVPFDA